MDARPSIEIPLTTDVVVVGGGVVGCFTALELARQGVATVVLEKARIGGEQSSRNWGYIRQAGRDDPEIPLMVEANKSWSSLAQSLPDDIDWAQRGNLRLLPSTADVDWYRHWMEKGTEAGIDSRIISGPEITSLLPRSEGVWAGAMFTPNDAQANPGRATRAVASAAAAAGARILEGVTATQILVEHDHVTGVATPSGSIATRTVVAAAGAWTRRLLHPLGLNLPLQWIRSTVAETAPVSGFPDIPAVWSPLVSFRKTGNGAILFASSGRADIDVMPSALNNVRAFLPTLSKNIKTFQVRVNSSVVLDTRNRILAQRRYSGWEPAVSSRNVRRSHTALVRIYPELAGVPIARAWAGYIDGTPDGLPVISTVPQVDGLVVGAGFSGHGFGLSPASGRALADLATTRRCGRHNLDPFRLTRFQHGNSPPSATIGR